jgi:CRISPR type I-D-associated protein Csc1
MTTDVINNLALLYAINMFVKVHRNASGNAPHYPDDLPRFMIYASPAQLLNSGETVIGAESLDFTHSTSPVKITYNGVDSTNIFSVETGIFHQKQKKLAHPKLGSYYKYPPLATFRFYTINGIGPRVLRLGKKMSPAVVKYEPVVDLKARVGEFQPDHPINLSDMPGETTILSASIVNLPNGVIAKQARLKGPYLEGSCSGERQVIAVPDQTRYPGVSFN